MFSGQVASTISYYIGQLGLELPLLLYHPVISSVAFLYALYLASSIAVCRWRRYASWNATWAPCAHRVRGGEKRGRCLQCGELENLRRQEAESHLAEHLLRIEFSRRAGDLAHAQYVRRNELAKRSAEMHDQEIARLKDSYVPKIEELRTIGSKRFEDTIATMFRRLGYKVEQTPLYQ